VDRFFHLLSNFGNVSEIAQCRAEAIRVLLQVNFGGVVQFVFVYVEDEDFVAVLQVCCYM
jgi:hypothetical protein